MLLGALVGKVFSDLAYFWPSISQLRAHCSICCSNAAHSNWKTVTKALLPHPLMLPWPGGIPLAKQRRLFSLPQRAASSPGRSYRQTDRRMAVGARYSKVQPRIRETSSALNCSTTSSCKETAIFPSAL